MHVIVGALMLAMLFVWTLLGYFGVRRHSTVSIAVIYWHFVTAVWIAGLHSASTSRPGFSR